MAALLSNSSLRKYDLVFLDAFKGGSVPYHLKTVEFYREIARSLTEEGILVTNLVWEKQFAETA